MSACRSLTYSSDMAVALMFRKLEELISTLSVVVLLPVVVLCSLQRIQYSESGNFGQLSIGLQKQ